MREVREYILMFFFLTRVASSKRGANTWKTRRRIALSFYETRGLG